MGSSIKTIILLLVAFIVLSIVFGFIKAAFEQRKKDKAARAEEQARLEEERRQEEERKRKKRQAQNNKPKVKRLGEKDGESKE